MSRIVAFVERLLPALLVAAAVALLAVGVAAWLDPGAGALGHADISSDRADATPEPGDADPGGDGPGATDLPVVERETPSPSQRPASTGRPRRTARPVVPTAAPTEPATPPPTPPVTPVPTVTPSPTPLETAPPTPTRVPRPTGTIPTAAPTQPPTPTPTRSPSPSPSPRVTPTPAPTRAPASTPTPTASAAVGDAVVATRIVIASRDIDLPIISRDKRVKGQGPDKYPPCDVALYHTAFQQPGDPGTTYIYAHAREGMFLPLLLASQHHDGAALIGALVQVYTSDEREYVYQVTEVKRHALDFSLALDAPAGSRQLILQTSEGPRGTVPKLQILAQPVDVLRASVRESNPKPHPRPCYSTP